MDKSLQIPVLLLTPQARLRARAALMQKDVDRIYFEFRRLVGCPLLLAGGRESFATYPVDCTPVPAEVTHALRLFHNDNRKWETPIKRVSWWARLQGDKAHWRVHFKRIEDASAKTSGRGFWRLW